MKKFRIILCAFLVAALAVPLISAAAVDYGAENSPNEKAYSQTFSDVPTNHWAFKFIAELVERKAIDGYPDGKFYPDSIVTRQEFAKIMVVAAGLTPKPMQTSSYSDVPANNWASPFIEAASGYLTAYRNSATGAMTYKPTAGALREDIAVAVVKLRGYDTRLADLSLLATMFNDVDAISTAAQPYVALAVENKIISGYTDSTFRGQSTITRAEAAAILWRAFQYGSDEKVIGNNTETLKPSPSLKPTTPPMPEKPYLADSLVDAKITDTKLLMTMNSDSDLIYYDANDKTIYKLDSDTKEIETLLNAAGATYIVILPAKGEIPETTVTYTNLEVRQVFWDRVGSRLLVEGTFNTIKNDGTNDGWETPKGNLSVYQAVFTLDAGKLTYLGDPPKTIRDGDYSYHAILAALSNGTFILSYGPYYHRMACVIYDFEKKVVGSWIGGNGEEEVSAIAQSGNDIYHVRQSQLLKYDYGTGDWNKVCTVPLTHAIRYNNGVFYTCISTEIRATKPNGQQKTFLNPSTDIEILDLLKLPSSLNNLFVTADEHFLFYDDVGKVIRIIYPNLKA